MHHDVTSCVICISNEVEYLEKEASYKNSTKEVIVILSDLCNEIKKTLDKISLHRHFKQGMDSMYMSFVYIYCKQYSAVYKR